MGSIVRIAKKIGATLLAACMALALVPVFPSSDVALAVNAPLQAVTSSKDDGQVSGDAVIGSGKQSSGDVSLANGSVGKSGRSGSKTPSEGEAGYVSGGVNNFTNQATTSVDVVYMNTDSTRFQIINKSLAQVVSIPPSKGDCVEVVVANAKGTQQGDFIIVWERALVTSATDLGSVTREVVSQPTYDTAVKDEATGNWTFAHPLDKDNFSKGEYAYWVTITDSKIADDGTGSNVAKLAADDPIRVVAGITYGVGMLGGKAPSGSGGAQQANAAAWEVHDSDTTKPGGTDEVTGLIQKGTTLQVTQPYTGQPGSVMPGEGTAYNELLQAVLASGAKVPGVVRDSSGNVVATGTGIFQLDIIDAETAASAFLDDIQVRLDANKLLEMLGLEELPSDFAETWSLMYMAPGASAVVDGSGGTGGDGAGLIKVSDMQANDDGTVTLRLTAAPGIVASGKLGTFALVCPIDPEHDRTFQITPQVKGPRTAGSIAAGNSVSGSAAIGAGAGGQVSPGIPQTYLVGAQPTFTFIPDDGYWVKSAKVYYSGTLFRTESGVQTTNPLPMPLEKAYNDGTSTTLKNTFTFDASLTGAAWERDATLVVEFAQVPPATESTFDVHVSVGEHGSATLSGEGIEAVTFEGGRSSSGYKTLPSNAAYSLTLNADAGYEAVLQGSFTGVDGSWVTLGVVGDTYRITKLVSDLHFRVTFVPSLVDYKTFHEVSAVVADKKGEAWFYADGTTGAKVAKKQVEHGQGVTLHVEAQPGLVLASARAYYVAGGAEVPGADLRSSYTVERSASETVGESGRIELPSVLYDTNVYLMFKKASTGTSSGAGNIGGVDSPDIVNVTLAEVRSMDGASLSPRKAGDTNSTSNVWWSSLGIPDSTGKVVVPLAAGSRQSIIYYYHDAATGKWWVLDKLEITDAQGGNRSLVVLGDANHATLDITGSMSIVAYMRPWTVGDDDILKPGDAPVMEAGPIAKIDPETGKPEVDASGNPIGKGGMLDDGGNWVSGGQIVPSTLEVVPGEAQTVVLVPDLVDPDNPWYWAIDEVVVDGITIIPLDEVDYPVQVSGPDADGRYLWLDYDPETGEWFYWWSTDSKGEVPVRNADGSLMTGDRFTYDSATGTLVFDPMSMPHTVQASFERAMDLKVSFNSGEGYAIPNADSDVIWLLYKEDVSVGDDGEGVLKAFRTSDGKRVIADAPASDVGRASGFNVMKSSDLSGLSGVVNKDGIKVVTAPYSREAVAKTDNAGNPVLDEEGNPVMLESWYQLESFMVNGYDRMGKMTPATEDEWKALAADAKRAKELRESGIALVAEGNAESKQAEGLFDLFAHMFAGYGADLDKMAVGEEDSSGNDGSRAKAALAEEKRPDPLLTLSGDMSAAAKESGLDLQYAQTYLLTAADRPESAEAISHVRNHTLEVQAIYKLHGQAENKPEPTPTPTPTPVPTPTPTPDEETVEYRITAKVVKDSIGKGYVEEYGRDQVTIPVKVKKGESGKHTLTFIPVNGYVVSSVMDSGVNEGRPQAWSSSSYVVDNVTGDRVVEVQFGMPGNNDNRVVRRITSFLRTGDANLPLALCALSVASAAAGVAVLIGGRGRKDERRR